MPTLAYLDTNALVKLYAPESGGDQVLDLLDTTDGVVTSVLTYTEARGVFARLLDRGQATQEEYDTILQNFEEDWTMALKVELVEAVYRRAGDLTVQHPRLRALDAIHLSSALEVKKQYDMKFLTFDTDLKAAATAMLGKKAVI